MSKPDAQNTTKAQNKTAPQTDATAANSGAAALVPATQAQPTAPDEHHGRGGLFIRQSDGTRLKAQAAPAAPDQPEKDAP
ncbi:hypothetical protein ACDW_12200 [Acidovorax sp. DW039]|uniref:hypothetical protein n=1 Tax=Acidovorax sp. DW039 TaxID=3095606 RepID=UPI0030913204|nr:hypothetical protein ACDW_12200 [Acidovorax sp. DW039]